MASLERIEQAFERAIKLAVKDARDAVAGHHQELASVTGLKPPDPTGAELRAGQHVERALREFFKRVADVKNDYAREHARPDAMREKLARDLNDVLKQFRKSFDMEFANSDISEGVKEQLRRFI